MFRLRLLCLSIISLAAALEISGPARAQDSSRIEVVVPFTAPTSDTTVATTKIYSLSDLGDDPNLGKWITDTIVAVIEPESWGYLAIKGTDQKTRPALSYYAPSKVMVIYHTPAVHAKVDEFLKDLKKATAANAKKPATVDSSVKQAQFVPAPIVAPTPSGYPIAGPLQQPKHLFHFIIRYEGDGILDSNVVEFAKALTAAAKAEVASAAKPVEPTASPVAVPSEPPPTGDTAPVTPVAVPEPRVYPVNPPKMPPAESEKKSPSGQ